MLRWPALRFAPGMALGELSIELWFLDDFTAWDHCIEAIFERFEPERSYPRKLCISLWITPNNSRRSRASTREVSSACDMGELSARHVGIVQSPLAICRM